MKKLTKDQEKKLFNDFKKEAKKIAKENGGFECHSLLLSLSLKYSKKGLDNDKMQEFMLGL